MGTAEYFCIKFAKGDVVVNKKIKIGVGAGLAAIILGGGYCWYSNLDKHKPEYAVQIAEQAVANHDKNYFHRYVDVDSVLDESYDGLIEGLTDSDQTLTPDAKDAVKNFSQILRAPLIASLKTAVDSYVETGDFNAQGDSGVKEILARTGIDKIEYRGLEGVTVNTFDENEAIARIKVYQPELAQEFTITAVLKVNADGNWQIVRLQNFQELFNNLNQSRRTQLNGYLEQTAKIEASHDAAIRDAEQKYESILSAGALNQPQTRADLRKLMLDVIKKDWQARKQELFSIKVPPEAQDLQNMRLKICDLEIDYANNYAQWLEDKKASTLRISEERQRQSNELKAEAATLLGKLSSN